MAIDEKKLIKFLKQRIAVHEKDAVEIDDYAIEFLRLADEVQAIIEVIEEQPKVNEWIPVSERLPEVGQRVLATEKEEVNFCTYEYFYGYGCGFYPSYGNVTAWMPLPEPYKEGLK